jgi:hypothetical protein
MKYLLIDFGASYIKNVIYDTVNDLYSNYEVIESPLRFSNSIPKKDILQKLTQIITKYPEIKSAAICSILGGKYINDIYYSWKCSNIEGVKNQESCIITDIFTTKFINKKIIGKIIDTNIFFPLVDTDCVVRSAELLPSKNILVNMGTGSQVVYIDEHNHLQKHQYIPSGRSLNVFANFFNELNINFFDYLCNLNLDDIISSTLQIDLNIYPQAHQYFNGGLIANMHETNFTLKNLIASILRCYLQQYEKFLIEPNNQHILLSGGIPKKIKTIKKYFNYKYPKSKINLISMDIDETLIGLSHFIKTNTI